jgi:serine/threonine-protein kinase
VLGRRYRLAEPLGSGGMSVVWRAHDEVLNRPVAVKVLAPVESDRLRSRLRSEALACGRLSAHGIARVYDYGEYSNDEARTAADEKLPYLVMEYVDGPPLSSRLADGGTLPWPAVAEIGAEIAGALAIAHAAGLVHRDIKPDNVVITGVGVKLIDFGISAAIGAADLENGELLGTAAYVAPERIIDAPVGPAADVYALGVLLYRALSGRLPWAADSNTGLLEAHLYLDPPPLPVAAGIPAELIAICTACMEKDPGRRPTSAQVAAHLAAVPAGPVGMARSAARPAGAAGGRATERGRATGVTAPLAPLAPLARSATGATTPIAARTSDETRTARVTQPFAVAFANRRGPRTPANRPGSRRERARRRATVLASAGLSLGLLGVAWASSDRGDSPAIADPGRACRAAFTVTNDWNGGFSANLAVTNEAAQALSHWEIAFAFPGGQSIGAGNRPTSATTSAGYTVSLRQQGADVSAGAAQALAPHESVTVPITASYAGANPAPIEFQLNGTPCATTVIAPAGPALAAPVGRPSRRPPISAEDADGRTTVVADRDVHGKPGPGGKGDGKPKPPSKGGKDDGEPKPPSKDPGKDSGGH